MRFPGRIYDVAWNADGRSLLVLSNVGGAHNDLWQVPLDNPIEGAVKLTFGQADEDVPSADSKGKRVVFTDNRRGPTALIVRDLGAERNSAITVSSRDFGSPTGKITIESLDADLMR